MSARGVPSRTQGTTVPSQAASRANVRASVYEAMKTLLMDQALEPGARLSIDGLARELRVSATPVREALARCESEGLVVRRPNAGYLVAPLLDREELDDLYDIRLLLEPEASRRAASRIDVAELAGMNETLTAMAPHVSGDTYQAYRGFAELDAAFHHAIATASGSLLIADTLRRLRAHTHGYRLYFRHGIAGDATGEHHDILVALRRGDGETAAAAMRVHLDASRLRLHAAYE